MTVATVEDEAKIIVGLVFRKNDRDPLLKCFLIILQARCRHVLRSLEFYKITNVRVIQGIC